MKNPEKLLYVLSIVLTIIYIPISFFSFFLGMVSEAVMHATNQFLTYLTNIASCVAMLVPIFCFAGIIFSIRCRKKGYLVRSFVLQVVPLIIFSVNLLLIYIIDILV